MTQESPAKTAAQRDQNRSRFAVYPGDGNAPFLTDSRSEAIGLAHSTNGNWTRVPYKTVAADLIESATTREP